MAKSIIFVLCFFSSSAFASLYVGAGVGKNHQTIPGGETGNPGDVWYTQDQPYTRSYFLGATHNWYGVEAGYTDAGMYQRLNVGNAQNATQKIATQFTYLKVLGYYHVSDNLRIFGSYGLAKYHFQNLEVATYQNKVLYAQTDTPSATAYTTHGNTGHGIAPIFGYGINYRLNSHAEIRASAQYLNHVDVSPWTGYSNLAIYSIDFIIATQ